MAAGLLPLGAVITGVAVLWLLLIVLRRSYLRRIATRHFTRRPTETLLVVLGSVLGTALITGSFITSDSLNDSFTSEIYRRFGEVDVQVLLTDSRAATRADRHLDDLRGDPRIDGVVKLDNDTAVARNALEPGLTQPRAQVFSLPVSTLDDFGSTRQTVGGPDLGADEAIVTKELADDLHLAPGDQVEVLIYGRSRTFRVDRVATGDGFAAYQDGTDVYVGEGVLADLAREAGRNGPATTELWVSNRGDARGGLDLSNQVAAEVSTVLGGDGVQVLTTKLSGVDAAQTAADTIGSLFLVVGSFAVIAGVLLLVNIFVMLAAERRSELGMLRAIGMKRADLVRGFVLEGSMYGASAALLGGVLGIAVGFAIVRVASAIFSQGGFSRAGGLDLRVVIEPKTLVAGILVGFAISFVTIALTSWRISRVNIIAAVRDLDEAKLRKTRPRTYVLAVVSVAVGGLLAVLGVTATLAIPAAVGATLVVLGLTPLLSLLFPRRLVVSLLTLALVIWTLVLPVFVAGLFAEDVGPEVFIVYGTISIVAAVTLVSQNQEALAQLAALVVRGSPRRGLSMRLATTYPTARRFRTAMTLIMYALIVFTLVLISSVAHVNQINTAAIVRRESSGYDVLMTSGAATPVARRDVTAVPGVAGALGIVSSPAQVEAGGKSGGTSVDGVDADVLALSTWALSSHADRYADDSAVWSALMSDPGVTVLSRRFERTARGGPPSAVQVVLGDKVDLTDPVSGRKTSREVIVFVDSTVTFRGAILPTRTIEKDFTAAGPTTWLVRAAAGTTPAQLSDALNAQLVDDGVEAIGFQDRIEDFLKLNLQFLTLLQGYLALGLIIGIVGLGVIMIRAVRERRRAIGVLRALGFSAATVRRAFVGEAGIVALEGVVVGVVLGIVTARNLLASGLGSSLDTPFAVPWQTIGILVGLAFVFSLVVAAFPARQAARIRPAVALRVAD